MTVTVVGGGTGVEMARTDFFFSRNPLVTIVGGGGGGFAVSSAADFLPIWPLLFDSENLCIWCTSCSLHTVVAQSSHAPLSSCFRSSKITSN